MSRELLCEWLDLPATPWPPNHYALLGLPIGEGTNEEIEQHVLERMEALRHHQLLHPEQVTEGMNLVVQAMICLTDPQSRREFDRQLGLATDESLEPLPELIEELPVAPIIDVPLPEKHPAKPARIEIAYADGMPPPLAAPMTLSPKSADAPDQLLIPELIEEEPLLLVEDEEEESETESEISYRLEEEPEPLPEPSGPPVDYRTPRRKLYAEIVRIRRVLCVWEQLRAYLDEPEKTFERRTDTVAFMSCLADLRPLLPTVSDLIGGPNQHGNLIAALSRQQLIVSMFRSLLPSQREALARDCQSAHYVLLEQYRDLRETVRRRTAKNFARKYWRPLLREIVVRPEWLLLFISVVALVIAFFRSVPK